MHKPHPRQIAFLKSKTPPVLYGGALPTRTGVGFDPRVLHLRNGSTITFGRADDSEVGNYLGSEHTWLMCDGDDDEL